MSEKRYYFFQKFLFFKWVLYVFNIIFYIFKYLNIVLNKQLGPIRIIQLKLTNTMVN